MKKIAATLSITLFALFVFSSCQTVKFDFEEGTNPLIYFQRAQTALDLGDYDSAVLIYRKLLDTNPADATIVVSAEYEIAFITYKRGQLAEAKVLFQNILEKYQDAELAPSLDKWPQALSIKLLDKIETKLNPVVPAAQ